jgi:hypothetical protein
MRRVERQLSSGCVGVIGTQCRSAAGVCDVAENCTGSSAACPAERLRVVGDGLPLVGRRL